MSLRIVAAVAGAVGGLVVGATVVAPQLTSALNAARTTEAAAETAPGATEADKPADAVVWRTASTLSLSAPHIARLADTLQADVSVLTGGELAIEVSAPGHLMAPQDTLKALSSGAVDAAILAPGHPESADAPADPALALLAGHPFGPGPIETMAWLNAGGGQDHLDALYADRGVHAIPCGLSAATNGGWFSESIETPEAFRDLRIRAGGLAAPVLQRLGANTSVLNANETQVALAADGLDAAVFPTPNPGGQSTVLDHAPVLYFPAWQQPSQVVVLGINTAAWDRLTLRSRAVLSRLCSGVMSTTLSESEATQYAVLRSLTAEGVLIRQFPSPVLDALRSAWSAVVDEIAADDPDFAAVWNDLQAFRENYAIGREIRTGDPLTQ